MLVGVTQVPCLTVHGHDQEIGLWKVQYTHSFVDDVRIFQKQLSNFLLVLPVEVIQDVSQLVHLVAELLSWDGCYRSVLNQSYHVEYDI